MKRLLAALFAGAALSAAAAPSMAAEVAYKLDEAHTETTFVIDRFGFNSVIGIFAKSEGTIWLDEAAPEKSRVEATVYVDSLLSANTTRDEHLKGERWLNAVKSPTMTFKSTKVEKTGADTARVTGDMTIMGVTQPVTLDVKLNKIGKSPNSQKQQAGFTITGTVSRKAFGSASAAGMIGDSVAIRIEALAVAQ
ncbi:MULTISPECIES: YceI family protein [unclassified Caulobacter]|uniref:YceI family protein n=1 Tax=unclassified Caulobacter TaxID=2648921 RepID=UPI000D352BB1|nr:MULTISPECIES: YceI family protein [unclassified Caulobacter]PTS87240.1 polyisoprenoid-binding protein [Caulobacter sp. HMWF009]PTT12466.1 polyisoprenoid-binding protein [Caulobacter sp. HMWF025]